MPRWGGEARCIFAMCFNGVSAFEGLGQGSRHKSFLALLGWISCFVSSLEVIYCGSFLMVLFSRALVV